MTQDTEQSLRIKLAAAHHIVHYSGWDDLLATHLSARVPGTNNLLITPTNVPFEEVTASRLIKCTPDGKILEDNGEGLMPQAINIHGEIYKASNTIMSAMHTHSLYGVAVASLKCGLLFQNQRALRFYDDVAYCEYNGLALEDEGKHIVQALQNKKVMILRCHGLLTTGTSIEEAVYLLHYLEHACETQIKILSTQQETVEIPKELCRTTKAQLDSIRKPELEFAALVNRIEGLSDLDYRA
jgi:ribulose-5-phosphate 4-epimerase/fuculose-1-phosphate aldolase